MLTPWRIGNSERDRVSGALSGVSLHVVSGSGRHIWEHASLPGLPSSRWPGEWRRWTGLGAWRYPIDQGFTFASLTDDPAWRPLWCQYDHCPPAVSTPEKIGNWIVRFYLAVCHPNNPGVEKFVTFVIRNFFFIYNRLQGIFLNVGKSCRKILHWLV